MAYTLAESMKTIRLLLLAAALGASAAMGAFKFESLPSAPKAAEIGEVIFNRSDWSSNDSETVTMPRDEFLRYFSEGVFHNEGKYTEIVYRSGRYLEPKNPKGGWIYCSGAFATKDGRVFIWNRARIGVLEIEDTQHRTGWLIIGESRETAQPAS